jgi:hypothetical protein
VRTQFYKCFFWHYREKEALEAVFLTDEDEEEGGEVMG